jgi:ribonuclease HII
MVPSPAPRVYAGIDEAGYGPHFGPLVVARTVFLRSANGAAKEDFWRTLRSAVCREVEDAKKRMPVNDSKLLYSRTAGIRHLEHGVLPFVALLGHPPSTIDGLMNAVAYDALSRSSDQPWYRSQDRILPLRMERRTIVASAHRLEKAMAVTGVSLADMRAAVVFEDRFNHMVEQSGNKAACAWSFVAGHLKAIWEEFGHLDPIVVIDRQGGRKRYATHLQELFPLARVTTIKEGFLDSRYALEQSNRTLRVEVRINGETTEFAVALASMMAKYVRELFMLRFQRFWSEHAPEVKPSAGYSGDGKRFLQAIESTMGRMGLDPRHLVRCR